MNASDVELQEHRETSEAQANGKSPTRSEGSRKGWEKRRAAKPKVETAGTLTADQVKEAWFLFQSAQSAYTRFMEAQRDSEMAHNKLRVYLESLTKGA